jgi:16S rRNA G966 N2-methylase RsmD
LEKTKLSAQAKVYCCSAAKALGYLDKEYDVILMDPPYADRTIGDFITQLANSRLVANKTTVMVTHSPHFPLEPGYSSLNLIKEHRHGDSCISIYRKEAKS